VGVVEELIEYRDWAHSRAGGMDVRDDTASAASVEIAPVRMRIDLEVESNRLSQQKD
jgi:hypothetical protein